MKKRMLVLTVVIGVVVASALYLNAMNSPVLRVNVPFDFQLGKAVLPAGTYVVTMERMASASPLGSGVLVRTLDGKVQLRVPSMPGNCTAKAGGSLIFNRYGNSYFLSAVQSDGLGCQLFKSKAEQEVASKAPQSQRAELAAE